MNKKINLKQLFSNIVNNDLSIKRMGMLYLFLPWLVLDVLLVVVLLSSAQITSGPVINFFIYLFTYILLPLFLIYLGFISALLIKKSLKLNHFIKKYAGLLLFGLISVVFFLLGLSLIIIGVNNLFLA